ncbi:hypothetical protein [Frederiksenia canicola]|uniref:Lipoprotein n=1 Tax=Frederiksenia canicola TaxID=123824 RepID=A0ABX9XVU3_9PAST|nr:hypothetical protein [Frederiksenia canicola]RPE96292.1 hypothetical protein EDC49_0681 [Frederiksenia canicola]
MKKILFSFIFISFLTACSTQFKSDYTTKPTFCYQLAPQEQAPGKNCIGSGGHQ